MSRNFTATVKEGLPGEPCTVMVKFHGEGGLGEIVLTLPAGRESVQHATALKRVLNSDVDSIRRPAAARPSMKWYA